MSLMNGQSEIPPGWGAGVYQATQIVAAELGVDIGIALLSLVERAQAETTTLHDIADDVIAERLLGLHKAMTRSSIIDLDREPDNTRHLLEEDGSIHCSQPFPAR
jgi:hypothetical protein